MCDLTEIMRQQGGPLFIENLNVACVGDLSDRDIEILNSRKGDIENAPADLTVIFTENSPNDSFNNAKLENLSETDLETLLLIKFQKEHLQHFLRGASHLNAKNQSSTGGLANCLHLKKDA